jgi:hypothetical protein
MEFSAFVSVFASAFGIGWFGFCISANRLVSCGQGTARLLCISLGKAWSEHEDTVMTGLGGFISRQ